MTHILKGKRRNSEKRREKSRDAARIRREKESNVFQDLTEILPLTQSQVESLDKTSVIRLCLSNLKLRQFIGQEDEYALPSDDVRMDKMAERVLGGFLLLLDAEGEIVYVSDSVTKYLGISHIDLIGSSVYDYSHPCDHDELREILTSKYADNSEKSCTDHTFFTRMKCTLTNRGRSVNLKSAGYKVLKCSGHLLKPIPVDKKLMVHASPMMAVIASPIPHPSNIEIPLDSKTFLSRHDMDMSFTYCDDRIKELTGYSPHEVNGKSIFDYHHALDSAELEKSYKTLFCKGQTMTAPYRFIAKHGGYVWLCTQATVINSNRTQKPQCVVCVNYLVSGIENSAGIFSTVQCRSSTDSCLAPIERSSNKDGSQNIFKGFDKDMDLTHLAPTAGDACILLGFHPCLSSVVEDEILLGDTEEDRPKTKSNPVFATDSVIIDPEWKISSPSIKLCDEQLNKNAGITVDTLLDDIDLETRAPYIPMDTNDLDLLDIFGPSVSPVSKEKNWNSAPISSSTMSCMVPLHVEPDSTTSTSTPLQSPISEDNIKSESFLQQQLMMTPSKYTQSSKYQKNPIYQGSPSSNSRLRAVNPSLVNSTMRPYTNKLTSTNSLSPPVNRRLMSPISHDLVPPHNNNASPINDINGRHQLPSIRHREMSKLYPHKLKRSLDESSIPYGVKLKLSKLSERPEQNMVKGMPQLANMLGYKGGGIMDAKSTLLKDLLLKGEATSHSATQKKIIQEKLLPIITTVDAEVNAPFDSRALLQGKDLFDALDIIDSPDSTTLTY